MTIGKRIQERRAQLRLTQEQLAERVEVSRQAVSKWEQDSAVPDTDKLIPLARTLGITVDELLGNHANEQEVWAQPEPERKQQPGWLKTHWYYIGLAPMIWGAYSLFLGLLTARQTLDYISQQKALLALPGYRAGETFYKYMGANGEIDYSPIIWALAGVLLLFLAATVAGVLIFALGRRHVRKKYGVR